MKVSELQSAFLKLVRLGIGHRADALSQNIDWQEVKDFAERHGLYAVVLDGIEKLPAPARPQQEFLLEWIGEVLQGYEYQYEQYCKVIAQLAGFYNSHDYKMMVLKGYACSLDWPKPSHRPCGDIDIWQFGKQKEADALIARELGIEIDCSHHHHTVFNWRDFAVENHYDFINVHHHKSHTKLEKILKEQASDDTHYVELKDASTGSVAKVYLPSANLHALFLLKHTMLHFVSGEIYLRQLLDWAFFVEKQGKKVDWKWLLEVLEEYGMMPAFNIFNAICVEDLGFDACIFPQVQFRPFVKDRALNDILNAESTNNGPQGLFTNLIYRYHRWKDSAWKHELCYKESMWSAFWYGIWGHLLKPASI